MAKAAEQDQVLGVIARIMSNTELRKLTASIPGVRPSLELALKTALFEEYVCDRQIADRWLCSVELLAKMRRMKTGPVPTKLSAGLIRYRLIDVLDHELRSRKATEGSSHE